jgi:hypothetical protein
MDAIDATDTTDTTESSEDDYIEPLVIMKDHFYNKRKNNALTLGCRLGWQKLTTEDLG